MIVQPVSVDVARFVALRMREDDAAEIFATRWVDDRELFAQEVAKRGPLAWSVGDGEPIACIGASQVFPGMWQSWMFATDKFDIIGKRLTKFTRRVIIPALISHGARRVQAYSMEGHHVAHRWLESFGAFREASLPRYGRNGETFHIYSAGWV
jgi:hypothetical protein